MAVKDDFANDIIAAISALSESDKNDAEKVWAAMYDTFNQYFGEGCTAVYAS